MTDRIVYISILLTAGILAYLNASMAGFLSIDDARMIATITSTSYPLKDLFLSGAGEYFRPLVVISYTVNAMFAGTNPAGFHTVNIVIHLLNSLLVYYLALSLFQGNEHKDRIALIASLIFLLNPLNTEAVVWISARPDLLCTSFALLTLILLVKLKEGASPVTLVSLVSLFFAYLVSLFS